MAFSFDKQRQMLVDRIASSGLRDPVLLSALRRVPREAFLPAERQNEAYDDLPVPVGAGHRVLSVSGVAALMEALAPEPGERILVVGGSGYTEALLACIVDEVVGVIHEGDLADTVRKRLDHLGYQVRIVHGDGSRGWPPGAPWDRIVVEAGAPGVPPELMAQLREGGRLLTATGEGEVQHLQRITRQGEGTAGARYRHEDLGEVRLVPLQGEAAFPPAPTGSWDPAPPLHVPESAQSLTTAEVISQTAEPIDDLETVSLDPVLVRTAQARVVLIGENSHGCREHARARARLTQAMIERHGVSIVALEADPADAARIDAYVRQLRAGPWEPASRFAEWQWHNEEVMAFAEWLREHNAEQPAEARVAVVGLDRLGLYPSIDALLMALDDLDADAAAAVQARAACLTPFERCASPGPTDAVQRMLDQLEPRVVRAMQDALRTRLTDAVQHRGQARQGGIARFVEAAGEVYRGIYRDDPAAWVARDGVMFDALEQALTERDPGARAVVWAHNRHAGGSVATPSERTLGRRCQQAWGDRAYRIGLLSHHGQILAARAWEAAPEPVTVPTSHRSSYEALLHTAGQAGMFLPLRGPGATAARSRLLHPRLERVVGVVYRPQDEPHRHYVQAVLAEQFDEVVWFDESHPVRPLGTPRGLPRRAVVGG